MKIEVRRKWFDKNWTIGEMYVDDLFANYTLEDRVRPFGEKIHGETAIPMGTYRVVIRRSSKFLRDMPYLDDVPGFVGIMIHTGNTAGDSEGCILVGDVMDLVHGMITQSRAAFTALWERISAAHKRGEEITIEIAGSP